LHFNNTDPALLMHFDSTGGAPALLFNYAANNARHSETVQKPWRSLSLSIV